MNTAITIITSLLTLSAAALAAWGKLQKQLAPYLAARRTEVVVLGGEADESRLQKLGYTKTRRTLDPAGVAGARAVVILTPSDDVVDDVESVRRIAPDAYVLLRSYRRIDGLRLGERLLISNSEVRLLSDLETVCRM